MNFKKVLILICTLLVTSGILVGCKAKENISENEIPIEKEDTITTMKLDFLVIPDQIIAFNKRQIQAMEVIKKEDQFEDTQEFKELLNTGTVVDNKIIIKMIFNKIKELEGNLVESVDMDKSITRLILKDDEKSDLYFREITVLEDGYIVIPLSKEYDMKYVKAKLPDDLMNKLEKVLNS